MKKNKAIVVLLCILLVLIGVTYVDVFGVNPEGEGSMSDINLGLDLAGGVSITYQVVGDEDPSATDMSDTIAKLQKRVENYSTEAIVYQEGTDRINIEIPGVSDANAILQELGRPGTLYFIAQTDDQGNQNYSQQTVQNPDGTYGVGYVLTKTIDELLEDGSIQVQGTDVKEASAGSLQTNMGSEFAVSLTMTDEGAKKFAEVTQRAFDKNESLAIYYDGNIISAPGVNAVITDGSAQISPMESYERAENLASTIRIGGLRLELEELHSKVVGAQLGVEAIDTSLKAGAIGLALVIIFMIVVYLIPGLASGIALLCYVALVILLLNGFDMTLTLSGVAGIILSIGMAVDANVIIFARIREELASGKTVRNAIKIGFDKALSAIIDGNITTLIAAGVLLLLGPGTVKGFAQTLALGIVLSMFTALVVTRYLLYAFYALGLKSEKLYGVGKEPRTLAIVSRKGIFFGVSLAVIVAGFVVMGVHKASSGDALNYSLEFKGGTATTVTFSQAMTLEQANADVAPLIEEIAGSAVQIQTVQDSNEVIFKTSSLDVEQREALNEMFVDKFGVDEKLITSETISSVISSEMKTDTVIAVVVAIIFMLLYIRIRFKDLRFGLSSIIALLHDVLVVLAFYAVARVSVSNTFVACMLTIVGYSINATIVIFDRIRENMATMSHKDDLKDVVDKSITQTMSRSIFTSLTTFIMVAVLYVLGVTSIRDFALPLMVGIVCGAYSSICLAGSLWYVFRQKFVPKKEK
ncbi:protein translocase subunit SecD [uncultured Acetatifactor sp.]|uniref:protein translocase subunit SecD n=1 Tax=uncultured Acetatifactor sp. TaxID=1671927 RepID=UPI00262C6A21|nr:protein translocase subunit SecD [uncultured Acetatifactor sp.]